MDKVKAVVATLPVKDQARADAFYKHTLGFTGSDKQMPGGTMLASQGGTEIFLYKTESTSGDATRLSLTANNFDEFVGQLTGANVTLETYEGMPGETSQKGVYEYEGTKVAWFKDTEGNVLNVISA